MIFYSKTKSFNKFYKNTHSFYHSFFLKVFKFAWMHNTSYVNCCEPKKLTIYKSFFHFALTSDSLKKLFYIIYPRLAWHVTVPNFFIAVRHITLKSKQIRSYISKEIYISYEFCMKKGKWVISTFARIGLTNLCLKKINFWEMKIKSL